MSDDRETLGWPDADRVLDELELDEQDRVLDLLLVLAKLGQADPRGWA